MKEKLNELSRLLLTLHRVLLHYEKDLHEKREGRTFTPHEMLNLSLNDANFAWLRKISDLIVALDTRVDEKDNPLKENDFTLYAVGAQELFFSESPEFQSFRTKLLHAVGANADVVMQLANLRVFLKNNPVRTN